MQSLINDDCYIWIQSLISKKW